MSRYEVAANDRIDPKENTLDNDEGVSARDDDTVWLPALVWINAVAMDLRMRACRDMMICFLVYVPLSSNYIKYDCVLGWDGD